MTDNKKLILSLKLAINETVEKLNYYEGLRKRQDNEPDIAMDDQYWEKLDEAQKEWLKSSEVFEKQLRAYKNSLV